MLGGDVGAAGAPAAPAWPTAAASPSPPDVGHLAPPAVLRARLLKTRALSPCELAWKSKNLSDLDRLSVQWLHSVWFSFDVGRRVHCECTEFARGNACVFCVLILRRGASSPGSLQRARIAARPTRCLGLWVRGRPLDAAASHPGSLESTMEASGGSPGAARDRGGTLGALRRRPVAARAQLCAPAIRTVELPPLARSPWPAAHGGAERRPLRVRRVPGGRAGPEPARGLEAAADAAGLPRLGRRGHD
eukprot:2661917-Pyramimonas_sp.AAC.1